jgi:hypothetical protein
MHLHHPLARRQQLLGQQVTQPRRRRWPRPAPATPASRQQPLRLRSPHLHLTHSSSAAPIATAVCEPLCESAPIITAAMPSLPGAGVTAAGMPHSGPDRLGTSFEPCHGKEPAGWHVVVNYQPVRNQRAGGSRASPSGPLDTRPQPQLLHRTCNWAARRAVIRGFPRYWEPWPPPPRQRRGCILCINALGVKVRFCRRPGGGLIRRRRAR